MKGNMIFTLATLIVCLAVASRVESRPWYIECGDSTECGLDSCCVVGAGRYSLPRCVPLRGVHSTCRPGGEKAMNATLNYPDGESVDLTNVFYIICPCQHGLYCSERTGTCQDLSESTQVIPLIGSYPRGVTEEFRIGFGCPTS